VLGDRLAVEVNPSAHAELTTAVAALAPVLSDTDLVATLRRFGGVPAVRTAVLAALGRRAVRLTGSAGTAVAGAAVASKAEPFTDIWEFVAWAEANRPDLDLKSRPTAR
jgi:hypothetical protein